MSATQTVTVKIELSGRQKVTIVGSDAGAGSHISVTTGLTMVTLYNMAAVESYYGAWVHPVDIAQMLPAEASTRLVQRGAPMESPQSKRRTTVEGPSLLIGAHGRDDAKHLFDRNLPALLVRIGTVTWVVTDRLAYDSMAAAYRKAERMAQIILTDARP
jgi:hypothetical protein